MGNYWETALPGSGALPAPRGPCAGAPGAARETAGVLHRHFDVAAERLQQLQLLLAKTVYIRMRRGENADHFAVHLQGKSDFGTGVRLAGNVIGINADIRRVMHTSGERHMADDSFSRLQLMTLVMDGAAMHRGQGHVLALPEVDVGFQNAEPAGNVVHDTLDQ